MIAPTLPSWQQSTTLLAYLALAPWEVLCGPAVNVALQAAFPAPPYLLELLESAAAENATAYFPLVDRIAEGYFSKYSSDQKQYTAFLSLLRDDGHINTPEGLSTFKLGLSTRSAAPRIAAHYQYFQTTVADMLPSQGKECRSLALIGDEVYCDDDRRDTKYMIEASHVRDLPMDRVLGQGLSCVLYTDFALPGFSNLHRMLRQKERNGECAYRIRYRPDTSIAATRLPVSGYGVELQLKRTDYIVIDDREGVATAAKSIPSSEDILNTDNEVADLKPLAMSELSTLGLSTASFILQSENPFNTLLSVTQDFPKYSSLLAALNASSEFVAEHKANRAKMVPAGTNVFWLNGAQLIERQIDAYSLVDAVRRERKLIRGVMDLGMNGRDAVALLGHNAIAAAGAEQEPARFDWRDEDEGGHVIIWLNNLEKDTRYAEFPTNLMSLLQQGMPGQLPPIRRDIFNLVFPVDLTKHDDVLIVTRQLQEFVKRKLSVRFGLVPIGSTEAAVEHAKVLHHISDTYGLVTMIAYLNAISESKKITAPSRTIFERVVADLIPRGERTKSKLGEVLKDPLLQERVSSTSHWVNRLRAGGDLPILLVNGVVLTRDDNWLQPMSQQLGMDMRTVQEGVLYQMISDETWIPGLFLTKAAKRRNPLLFPNDPKDLTILDVNKIYNEHDDLFGSIPIVDASPDATKEDGAVLMLFTDLNTKDGQQLLVSALVFRAANPGVRLELIHNPADTKDAHQINSALRTAQDELLAVDSIDLLSTILAHAGVADTGSAYNFALTKFLTAAHFEPGASMLLLNGRVIGPVENATGFEPDDFQMFLQLERAQRILPVYAALTDLGMVDKLTSPQAAARVSSIVALSAISDLPEGIFESTSTLRLDSTKIWNSTHTALEVGDPSTATMHVVVCLNPASEQGQRWVPILKVLSELEGVFLKIYLNPRDRLDELPIKRFYRYVLHSAPSFDEDGRVKSLSATFTGLPSEALLNAGLDVPPAWLVAAKESVHDLDNLKLSSIKADVEAVYELENILIEGHSRQADGQPPRGVQLVLRTDNAASQTDTIIMANIGYFQFKANPGLYNIQLQEGRSTEIFRIENLGAESYSPTAGDEGNEVALMDFMGTTLYPRINRKKGMELEDVLEESNSDGSVKDYVAKGLKFAEGIWGSTPKNKQGTFSRSSVEHADINIFSVASGHLYERMLNIMMVSVMRHTNHTVKFWFIEQFLSPSFKEFIPSMAEEYGFKYEMVTYKWPHWLRQQKEKQREIWGYKILFLDVLFPLSLDKVIFVDADQIVRTDMYNLVSLDLKGAPYGFTPMCDSRVEMEGFRFWKQGYWSSYLRGAPYHISALYVVDLKKFRELAAGDRLRQQYHALSADPGSLSNLDQDLPNHMQFQIPIHSLPQEWLWCETWCSDETLQEAKTIDLCNNPQTKEPKLDRARRQVPEWNVYDDEIAALHKRSKPIVPSDEEGSTQRVLKDDPITMKNTKSRRLEDDPKTRTKDEL